MIGVEKAGARRLLFLVQAGDWGMCVRGQWRDTLPGNLLLLRQQSMPTMHPHPQLSQQLREHLDILAVQRANSLGRRPRPST